MSVVDNGTIGPDAFTSQAPGIRRLQVDEGEAAFFEGREYRISKKFVIGATPLVIRFQCPRGFTLYDQHLSLDSGAIEYTAWRSTQGTAGGSFSAPVPQWAQKSNEETPDFTNPIVVDTGGTFTPTPGVEPVETVRLFVNASGAGPGTGRGTVGSEGVKERGLAAGTYYLKIERMPDVSVDSIGVLSLVYAADRTG